MAGGRALGLDFLFAVNQVIAFTDSPRMPNKNGGSTLAA